MKQIVNLNSDAIEPGQRLAEDIMDENGCLLVPAETEIDERIRARLQQDPTRTYPVWREVEISAAELQAQRDAALTALDQRFRLVDGGVAANALKQAVADFIRRKFA
jgi:hypothetical protein